VPTPATRIGPGHRLADNFLRSFAPGPCNGDNQPYHKQRGNRQHREAPPADGSRNILKEEETMSGTNVARVTEIIAESPKGFDDAVQVGFKRAASTLRGITGLRIVEQRVSVKDNKINTYRVKMEVIFILD
jgi:flavin-binding protein dodecin